MVFFWFLIVVIVSVFVVLFSVFKVLFNKFFYQKVEFNFWVVIDECYLEEFLQELFKMEVFSEVWFIEEYERNLICLFNMWLYEKY